MKSEVLTMRKISDFLLVGALVCLRMWGMSYIMF